MYRVFRRLAALIFVLMLTPAAAAGERTHKPGDPPAEDSDGAWTARLVLSKFERQISTDSHNDYAEWAGLFVLEVLL